MTEAAVQLNMECADGKEESAGLPLLKNFPVPPTGSGLCRRKAIFNTSFTARLLSRASQESKPVSRCREFPVQLPQAYMKAGTAIKAPAPPLAMLSLSLMASALARARSMLCWSLPINTPVAPIMGANQNESRGFRRNGLVQIAF